MKRILMFAFISLLIVLAGCNTNNSTGTVQTEELSSLKDQINQLTAENKQLKEQLESLNGQSSPESESPSEPEPAPESTAKEKNTIELKKSFEVSDFAEITLTKAKFTSKVVPPKPRDYYSYYEVKDADNIYLETVLNVKSLLTSGKSSDEFASVTVIYDEKYKYNSFSTIEESGGSDFTYTNITSIEPLKTGILHFISELPKEASKDDKSINVVISINGDEFNYKLR
ncbi:hypothetical protein J4772_17450 [Cohnella sp. LGH]|uniref:hypothetical protein n=1 Tax=Cohnella sp. LGH TaxID=1619153 RepID=UPI001ADD12D8|nr:hypothetical protein [Cohnella sp. LGH]QTH46055.1 hypothetical protein J4772_17450 [Cohnella sp. LGH]